MTAPEVALRPVGPEDADGVAALRRAARPGAAPLDAPGLEAWVADEAGVPVGLVSFTRTWVDDLYVDPERQRRGIGTLLLDVVRARRPDGFGLWVLVDNAAARAFYAARGLVELERTDGSHAADGRPEVHLAWPGEDPLGHLRDAIDEVDDELALLLARRFALAAAVQDHKAAHAGVGGEQARDATREAEIVQRMAGLAPGVEPSRVGRVMRVVLDEGITAWHEAPRAHQ